MKLKTLLLFLVVGCYSLPIPNKDKKYAENYLKQYGYISGSYDSAKFNVQKKMLFSAIVEFQNFAGMNTTGNMDSNVMEMMHMARCGVKDMKKEVKIKRYALHGTSWKKRNLNFFIKKYTRKLKRDVIKSTIRDAFNIWSKYAELSFNEVEKENNADFVIGFHSKRHFEGFGDEYNSFDGKGNVLAHAYFPRIGQIHFDDDEDWSVNKNTDLYHVAAHEIGHALGLEHSDEINSLMTPFYRGYSEKFRTKLHKDDIDGIRTIYKAATNKTIKPNQKLCNYEKINTIFIHNNILHIIINNTLIFNENGKWILQNYKKFWKGVPLKIKAFSFSEKYYIFSGNKYWRFDGEKMDGLYPKKISDVFAGIPNNIDAVMSWKNKAYFFKGNKYWVYNSSKYPRVTPTFPKLISDDFYGIPNNLDAIIYEAHSKQIIAFKNNDCYYFDTITGKFLTKRPIKEYLQCK